jgi:A/G-specific adenine glycosylase
MPWRGVADPYKVWISEIMLQQTTVAAVIPYYQRFMARFPNLSALAAADVQDVLGAWEGLGYYSRGRNLHRAAQILMREHSGKFPRDVDNLRALPGIGRYTAGAIASFAFDEPAPILEANTQRVYARLSGYGGDPRSTEGQLALWGFAETIVPAKRAGAFNQALIDLGALVCVPVNPRCDECPVASLCRAFRAGRQNEIPPPKARPKVTEVHEAVVAIRRDGRWLVRQRQPGERWAGMWDFPRVPLNAPVKSQSAEFGKLHRSLLESTGLRTDLVTTLPGFSHSVTRYRIHLARFVVAYASGEWSQEATGRWVTLDEMAELPVPMAMRRFVTDLLNPGWDPEAAFELVNKPRQQRKLASRPS